MWDSEAAAERIGEYVLLAWDMAHGENNVEA
jgi:hypothetical protein